MKPINKAIKLAYCDNKNWKKEIYRFLLNYRSTPHCTTGYSPAELLFNRKINNKLPQTKPDISQSKLHSKIVENDKQAKAAMKIYADTRKKSKESNINIGDVVLVKQPKRNKFTTRFNPDKYSVIAKKGTMITAQNSKGHKITRNISFFRKVDFTMDETDMDSNDGFHDDDNDNSDEPVVIARRYPQRNERRRVERYGQNIYDH